MERFRGFDSRRLPPAGAWSQGRARSRDVRRRRRPRARPDRAPVGRPLYAGPRVDGQPGHRTEESEDELVVQEWERVLVYEDGRFETVLDPGRRGYGRGVGGPSVVVRPRLVVVPLQGPDRRRAGGQGEPRGVRVVDPRTWFEAVDGLDVPPRGAAGRAAGGGRAPDPGRVCSPTGRSCRTRCSRPSPRPPRRSAWHAAERIAAAGRRRAGGGCGGRPPRSATARAQGLAALELGAGRRSRRRGRSQRRAAARRPAGAAPGSGRCRRSGRPFDRRAVGRTRPGRRRRARRPDAPRMCVGGEVSSSRSRAHVVRSRGQPVARRSSSGRPRRRPPSAAGHAELAVEHRAEALRGS